MLLAGTEWPWRRLAAAAVCLSIWTSAIAGACQVQAGLLETQPYEYNVAAWEARHFANKWLFELGSAFRGPATVDVENDRIVRFLQLTQEIERSAGAETDTTALRRERDAIENEVEAAIERRLTVVLERERFTRSLPLLGAFVWPPVDFELAQTPYTLALSRRDRIELKDTVLLREDLSQADLERIEDESERRQDVSALSFSVAGFAAYPALIDYQTDYARLLELAAHEWIHAYLFFRPLGFHYYDNQDLRAMNETVADLAGRELARRVLELWPLTELDTPDPGSSTAPSIDIAAELRRLRVEVDALLSAGDIGAAESLMEQRRRELNAQGARLRKLNQAFFAFTNLYAGEAGNPAATNPIGPKIDELRRRSASLRHFIDVIGSVISVEGLDKLLAD